MIVSARSSSASHLKLRRRRSRSRSRCFCHITTHCFTSSSQMDRSVPERQGYASPITGYKQYHGQMQSRVTERDIITMISERDAAIQQRNMALSEKWAVLAQRDLAVIQRDTALAERDHAIKERDQVLAHLQLLENKTQRDNA